MDAGRDQTRKVCHVDEKNGADLICDLPEPSEVENSRIRRGPHQDHLRPMLFRKGFYLVVIDPLGLTVHPVWDDLKETS